MACAASLRAQTSAPVRVATTNAESLASLQTRISNHIHLPRFAAAHWGVKIVSLESGQTIFEHNAGKYFIPASNTKLFTGALALDRLGTEDRIRTSLYANVRPDTNGELAGDLVVYGRGDPSFSPRFHGGDVRKSLDRLADTLTAAGVKRIRGELIGDESVFRAEPLGAGWQADDLDYYYAAEVSALSVNDNVFDVNIKPGPRPGTAPTVTLTPPTEYLAISNRARTLPDGAERLLTLHRPLGQNVMFIEGGLARDDAGFKDTITMHRPAGLFLALFREALARHAITVAGPSRIVDWRQRAIEPLTGTNWFEIGFVESPPMAKLVYEMEKPSHNLYAHLLLLQVGARYPRQEPEPLATDAAGLAELKSFLARARVPAKGVLFEEGSGLSYRHLVTPDALVALLQFMTTHPASRAFRDALPVAGVDGTLQSRMNNTASARNVRAKTGSLQAVNAMSGYVTTAAGERLVFALLLNHYATQNGASAELDAITVMLAEWGK